MKVRRVIISTSQRLREVRNSHKLINWGTREQRSRVSSPAVFLSLVPSVPRSFRIQQRHLDSIYVDWDIPAEPNGVIIGYSLKYQTGTQNPTSVTRRNSKALMIEKKKANFSNSTIPHATKVHIPTAHNITLNYAHKNQNATEVYSWEGNEHLCRRSLSREAPQQLSCVHFTGIKGAPNTLEYPLSPQWTPPGKRSLELRSSLQT